MGLAAKAKFGKSWRNNYPRLAFNSFKKDLILSRDWSMANFSSAFLFFFKNSFTPLISMTKEINGVKMCYGKFKSLFLFNYF